MPTIEQIRAARALLGWSQHDLADKAGLSQTGIARIENGTNKPNSKTIEKITHSFDAADVEFLATTGVQKRGIQSHTYTGKEGFKEFMDRLYQVARDVGGEICTFNAATGYFKSILGDKWYQDHADRMKSVKDNYRFRLIVDNEATNYLAADFGEYRTFPKDMLPDQKIYVYGDYISFMNFNSDNVDIVEIKHAASAHSFRILFDIAWNQVAKPAD
ncbi:MAG: multiprotein-bridging factor 1 family protein [Bdellovibrionales bacterium]